MDDATLARLIDATAARCIASPRERAEYKLEQRIRRNVPTTARLWAQLGAERQKGKVSV